MAEASRSQAPPGTAMPRGSASLAGEFHFSGRVEPARRAAVEIVAQRCERRKIRILTAVLVADDERVGQLDPATTKVRDLVSGLPAVGIIFVSASMVEREGDVGQGGIHDSQ